MVGISVCGTHSMSHYLLYNIYSGRRKVAGTKHISSIPAAADFTVLDSVTMMSVSHKTSVSALFPILPCTFPRWRRLFSRSVAVHFFSHTSK